MVHMMQEAEMETAVGSWGAWGGDADQQGAGENAPNGRLEGANCRWESSRNSSNGNVMYPSNETARGGGEEPNGRWETEPNGRWESGKENGEEVFDPFDYTSCGCGPRGDGNGRWENRNGGKITGCAQGGDGVGDAQEQCGHVHEMAPELFQSPTGAEFDAIFAPPGWDLEGADQGLVKKAVAVASLYREAAFLDPSWSRVYTDYALFLEHAYGPCGWDAAREAYLTSFRLGPEEPHNLCYMARLMHRLTGDSARL